MKKLAVALAALMLLSCTSYTAFAAEADIKQVPDNQGIPGGVLSRLLPRNYACTAGGQRDDCYDREGRL